MEGFLITVIRVSLVIFRYLWRVQISDFLTSRQFHERLF